MITRVTVLRRHIHLHQTFTCITQRKLRYQYIFFNSVSDPSSAMRSCGEHFAFNIWPTLGSWMTNETMTNGYCPEYDFYGKSTDIAMDLMTNQTIRNGLCLKLNIPHGKSVRTFATERNGWWTRNRMFLYFFSCDHRVHPKWLSHLEKSSITSSG